MRFSLEQKRRIEELIEERVLRERRLFERQIASLIEENRQLRQQTMMLARRRAGGGGHDHE